MIRKLPRTVDLSGLGNTPLFSPAKGNYTLNMESVVFSNAPARVFFYNNSSSSAPISLKISDNVSFTKNYSSDRNSFTANGYGGAICLYSSAATALSMGNNAMFADNRAAGNGGAISIHSYGKTASLTIGNQRRILRKLCFRQWRGCGSGVRSNWFRSGYRRQRDIHRKLSFRRLRRLWRSHLCRHAGQHKLRGKQPCHRLPMPCFPGIMFPAVTATAERLRFHHHPVRRLPRSFLAPALYSQGITFFLPPVRPTKA